MLPPGEKLKRAREARNMTQTELASLLSIGRDKIHQSFVWRVEEGETTRVDFDVLGEWCKRLGVDANGLLGLKPM